MDIFLFEWITLFYASFLFFSQNLKVAPIFFEVIKMKWKGYLTNKTFLFVFVAKARKKCKIRFLFFSFFFSPSNSLDCSSNKLQQFIHSVKFLFCSLLLFFIYSFGLLVIENFSKIKHFLFGFLNVLTVCWLLGNSVQQIL